MKLKYSLLVLFIVFSQFPIIAHAENLEVSAKSAILMEQDSGRILYEKDAYEKRKIASITKIMTAIIAIESGKLKEKVKIKKKHTNIEGSSIYLEKGETITLEDLVYGLMLRSGNDAAVAIADHVGGSVEGFVFLMNEKAKQLGMEDTHFANPHGLDDSDNHYSTAYDMAILTQYAMKNKTFQKIFGTKFYKSNSMNEEKVRYWKNKHKLVTSMYKYATGGKTGYTKKARRTLVTTAEKKGMSLIAVTLDAPNDWNDHIRMFEYAFENFERVRLVNSGNYPHIKDPFYKNKLLIKKPVYYPLSESEKEQIQSYVTLLKPPKNDEWVKHGVPEPVGRLHIQLEQETIATVPLFFDGSPKQKQTGFWKKIIHFLKVDQHD